jgi:hypothetical protein
MPVHRSTRLISSLLLTGLAFSAGCAEPAAGTALEEGPLVDQPSSDITVLEADTRDEVRASTLTPDVCFEAGGCTTAFEEHFGAPALHLIPLPSTPEFFCRVLHVTTITKRAALERSSGIGFFYSGVTSGSDFFVAKDRLAKIGEATLKDGTPVDLHEFIGLANCWRRSPSSSAATRYEFKPYLLSESNGEVTRNWDRVEKNHAITPQAFAWDRSGDLLR